MKVLLIGGGGREHAIAWKLAESELVEKVFVAPGNGGTAREAKCENKTLTGVELLVFAQTERIELTVVGPEAPLAEGIVDQFRKAGLAVIGPDKAAMQLEASKVFAKDFMVRYGVRTAKSCAFSNCQEALSYVETLTSEQKVVIKADGLAAGKGVLIAETVAEAKKAIVSLMQEKTLGDAGKTILIEEFLEGREVSVLAAVSARPGAPGMIRPFAEARDYKRRFDADAGPNTGGMGAIAPVPDFSSVARDDFIRSILKPTLRGIESEGFDYRGFIFFGLMISQETAYLLEYNGRLGDPETQAVLPLMDADFARLCLAVLDGGLASFPLAWRRGAVCAPVAVADGYPSAYHKGDLISIDCARFASTNVRLFIAGAELRGTELYTTGGRVLAASAYGADALAAQEQAYTALAAIRFDAMSFRKDIGSTL